MIRLVAGSRASMRSRLAPRGHRGYQSAHQDEVTLPRKSASIRQAVAITSPVHHQATVDAEGLTRHVLRA